MQHSEHLLAVLEPNETGEASLEIATCHVARGGKATLLIVLNQQVREDFRRFADAENRHVYNGEAVALDRLVNTYTSRVGGEDTEAIVADSVQAVDDRFRLESLDLKCGSHAPPAASVRLEIDGKVVETEASGVGPVDAIFLAISKLTDTRSELIRYQVHAVTAGLDAQGEVSVTIEEDERRVIGNGVHEDVMVASAKAYVHALNKLEWHKQRRDVNAPPGI